MKLVAKPPSFLHIFFFLHHRIGAMFLFLWMPSIAIIYVFRGLAGPWLTWSLGLLSHTQGLVSALLTLGKDDVRRAVVNLLRRCVCLPPKDDDDDKRSGKSAKDRKRPQTSATVAGSSTLRISGLVAPVTTIPQPRYTTDSMGLPLQGSDFEFLDETCIEPTDEEKQHRAPEESAPTSLDVFPVDHDHSTRIMA